LLRWSLAAPRQRIPLWIASRQEIHEPPHHASERPAALASVSAEAAQRSRADPAEARGKGAFEGVGIVRAAQRFEVADQETHHLVSGGSARTAHLVGQAQRAQRLLERPAKGCGAAQKDGEVAMPELWRLGVKS